METIRFAQEADAAELLSIYAPYIKDTAITFECEIPSLDEFRDRIRKISSDYPYIVYLVEGKIIGYAYAHRHMERSAYQWNAELSVYIDTNHVHRGVGKALYTVLIELLKLQNVRNIYGGVTLPNVNSEKLHAYFGFKKLGEYHHTGYKCGAWHTVAWFEKTIGAYSLDPLPFVPINVMDKKVLGKLLTQF